MSLYLDIEKRLGNFCLRMKLEAEDETVALLGASGSGKSLTLRCIAGIERPDRGKIIIDGVTVFDSERKIDLPPQKRQVGILFQNYALFPHMTVVENIRAGAMREPDSRRRQKKISQVLEGFGLAALADRYPHQLSGGEQQRTALARILVSNPKILLLDEPFSALDSHLRFRLEQQVRQVIRDFDGTVLLVSHDRDEVFRMSDCIAVLDGGRLQTVGTVPRVFADPVTRTGAALTGCKNISTVKKLSETRLIASDWGIALKILPTDRTVEAVGIRMHDIVPGPGENSFPCRVVEVVENPFSVTVMVKAQPDAMPLGMELPKERWKQLEDDTLQICLPPEKLLLLQERNDL